MVFLAIESQLIKPFTSICKVPKQRCQLRRPQMLFPHVNYLNWEHFLSLFNQVKWSSFFGLRQGRCPKLKQWLSNAATTHKQVASKLTLPHVHTVACHYYCCLVTKPKWAASKAFQTEAWTQIASVCFGPISFEAACPLITFDSHGHAEAQIYRLETCELHVNFKDSRVLMSKHASPILYPMKGHWVFHTT